MYLHQLGWYHSRFNVSRNAGCLTRVSHQWLPWATACLLVLSTQFRAGGDPATNAEPPRAAPSGASLPASPPLPSSAVTKPRARVVSVSHPEATESFRTNPDVVRKMVDRGITKFTGVDSPAAAWRSLVSTQDIIGLKLFSVPGPNSGTRAAVVAAVIEGLLASGIPTNHIVIWDRNEIDLRLAGYFELAARYHVRVAGAAQVGYDQATFYDSPLIGNLVHGDVEFGRSGPRVGRRSFVSKLVSQELTKIINLSVLLNHNLSGTSGNLYSLTLGCLDNVLRFEADPERLAMAVPEIYALPSVGDKVVLSITDALICQYEGTERSLLHYSRGLNQLWFSRDPVALDVLAMHELDRFRMSAGTPRMKARMEIYTNAELLELGVSDLKRIDVESHPLAQEMPPDK